MWLLCVIILIGIWYLPILYQHFRKVKILTDESKERNTKTYKQAPGPFPWPVFGNLNLLASCQTPSQTFTELSKKFGDIYTLTLGSTKCLVVNNLELIREVLAQNGQFFGGRPNFIRYHKLFGGDRNNSLALCDWSLLQKRRRNLARRHCSPRDTSPYFAKMSEIGCSEIDILLKTLTTSITDGKPTLLKHFIQRACANMFFQYMCSVRFDYKDNEFCEVVGFFDEIFWEINQGYAVDFLPWLAPLYKKHMNSLINWSSKIRSFILNRIIYKRENNNEQRQDDFTSALLKSLNEDSNVSRDTIIFMLEDFIGGHSAVGNLVMLIIMYLIKHPNVAKNIQLEADSVPKPSHRTINFYDMDSMPYTMATIFEVLRCSSSPIVPHVATQDTLISGYGVAKGTIVFINNHNLNHNKLYWKQPECFIPERFLKNTYEEQKSVQSKRKLNESEERENDIAEKNMIIKNTQSRGLQIRKGIPYFLPFSIGKRTCIGQNLVRGFGFILVANILRHFNISYDMNSEIEINTGSIALPTKPISVYLIKRKEIF
uniref:Cytochrome P450 307a1 n=1 Tax=Ceratitis capitata TaxID=7213 RepID=W8C501_CERCA